MVNYSNGCIYAITNSVNNKIYIGSTTYDLSKRFAVHKSMSKTRQHLPLYKQMNKLGIEHWKIEPLEYFPCKTKAELAEREDYWMMKCRLLRCSVLNQNRARRLNQTQINYIERTSDRYRCACCGYHSYLKPNLTKHERSIKHIRNFILS